MKWNHFIVLIFIVTYWLFMISHMSFCFSLKTDFAFNVFFLLSYSLVIFSLFFVSKKKRIIDILANWLCYGFPKTFQYFKLKWDTRDRQLKNIFRWFYEKWNIYININLLGCFHFVLVCLLFFVYFLAFDIWLVKENKSSALYVKTKCTRFVVSFIQMTERFYRLFGKPPLL